MFAHWVYAQGAPADGYEAARDRVETGSREHLARA
jgi:hypothetical protein